MPQLHIYTNSQRSPRFSGDRQKHDKNLAASTHFITHSIEIETAKTKNGQNALFEDMGLSSRRPLTTNLRLTVPSPQEYPAQHNLTWLSPIEKIEMADSEDYQYEKVFSLEESFFGDLSPINVPNTPQRISDESKNFLNVFNTSLRNEAPKQSQSTYKEESQPLFKSSNFEDELSKEMSTDLSIEIQQIDNVTKKPESEGSTHSANDMILADLDMSTN